MRETTLTLPELGLVAGTRAALGAGIGLLVADRLDDDTRRAIGWTLVLVGVATTIPLAIEVLGKRRLSRRRRVEVILADRPAVRLDPTGKIEDHEARPPGVTAMSTTEETTMGRVTVDLVVANNLDMRKADEGLIGPAEVRQVRLKGGRRHRGDPPRPAGGRRDPARPALGGAGEGPRRGQPYPPPGR